MPQTMIKSAGTFDHARPVDQMQAIDLILCHYFQASNWLRARQQQRKR